MTFCTQTVGPLAPQRAQAMGKQAEGSELTLLENICQEEGKAAEEGGERERGEKQINNNVEHDNDDNHS